MDGSGGKLSSDSRRNLARGCCRWVAQRQYSTASEFKMAEVSGGGGGLAVASKTGTASSPAESNGVVSEEETMRDRKRRVGCLGLGFAGVGPR